MPKRDGVALQVVPCDLKTANEFVRRLHRHSRPVVGHKFAVAVAARLPIGDALYRRRSCGNCGRAFVTCEHAPPGLKMPPQHNNRAPAKPPAPKHRPIRSDGAHLQGVWSLLPKEK